MREQGFQTLLLNWAKACSEKGGGGEILGDPDVQRGLNLPVNWSSKPGALTGSISTAPFTPSSC